MGNNTFIILFLFISFGLCSQDSIRTEDLRPFSYPFDLAKGQLSGEGAEILRTALSQSDIVMLGNNSRDKMESDLAITIAEILNDNEFKNVLIETGPYSAELAYSVGKNSSDIVNEFKSLNRAYSNVRGDLVYTPIPDFKNLEAANFAKYLIEENWNIGGFGTESWTGFKMMSDHLYKNLPPYHQETYKKLYDQSMSTLDSLYDQLTSQTNEDIFNLANGLKESKVYQEYLNSMLLFDINRDHIKSLKFSIEYWWMYGSKQFYEKNKLNSRNNKRHLKYNLEKWNFDFQKDKLLVKMWHGHLAKGKTGNGFYGIGNTLLELAEYNDRQSLAIAIFRRYYEEGEEVKDLIEESYFIHSKELLRLGQKNNWLLIDLRPFNQVFHWGSYHIDAGLRNLMNRYDMIIIPKTDKKTDYNY